MFLPLPSCILIYFFAEIQSGVTVDHDMTPVTEGKNMEGNERLVVKIL